MEKTLEEIFWPKVDRNGPTIIPGSPCWVWTGATYSSGHGCLGYEGRTVGAHRMSFQIHKGPIPQGLQILHKCDVRACVHPDHIWAGTNADNVKDKMNKGRHRTMRGKDHWTSRSPEKIRRGRRLPAKPKQPLPKGPNRELTDEQVREIVERVADGQTAYEVGIAYDIVLSTVYRLCHGKLRPYATSPEVRARAGQAIEQRRLKGRRRALSDEQVALLYKRAQDGARQWEICQELGVSQALISKILNGKAQGY